MGNINFGVIPNILMIYYELNFWRGNAVLMYYHFGRAITPSIKNYGLEINLMRFSLFKRKDLFLLNTIS